MRAEAIERTTRLFLQVLEHNDNRLTDAVFDSINSLRNALALPEDAEHITLKRAREVCEQAGYVVVPKPSELQTALFDLHSRLTEAAKEVKP